MAPGIKDKYSTITLSFKFCKFKLNLIKKFKINNPEKMDLKF